MLYHITHDLNSIILSDKLKPSEPAILFKSAKKSISLTRSKLYTHTMFYFRLVLDRNKLTHNHSIFPIDEISVASSGKFHSPKSMPSKKRYTIQNIYKYDEDNGLEHEFEERILDKEVKNLGKYITALQFTSQKDIDKNQKVISEYLVKYPHIQIHLIDFKNLWKRPQIVEILKPELV